VLSGATESLEENCSTKAAEQASGVETGSGLGAWRNCLNTCECAVNCGASPAARGRRIGRVAKLGDPAIEGGAGAAGSIEPRATFRKAVTRRGGPLTRRREPAKGAGASSAA